MMDFLPRAAKGARMAEKGGWRRAISGAVGVAALTGCLGATLGAQGLPTAARAGDLQIGGGLVLGAMGFNQEKIRGGAIYSTFDFTKHLGVEAEFHQAQSISDSTVYERTYEVGGRYHWNFGPLVPYGKVMIGRGVFNYPNGIANLAYNMFAAGAGADFHAARSINVRLDYEFQNWASFPQGDLRPNLVTIGVAYHFHE